MDRKEYADKLMKAAWRKIEAAHGFADPMLHEYALRLMARADELYEGIQ